MAVILMLLWVRECADGKDDSSLQRDRPRFKNALSPTHAKASKSEMKDGTTIPPEAMRLHTVAVSAELLLSTQFT